MLRTTDRPVLEEVLRHKKIKPLVGDRLDARPRPGAPLRARPPQAGAAQARLAGRGPGRLRRRRGAPHRPRRGRLVAAALPAAGRRRASGTAAPGVVVLPCGAGKTLVGAGAMAQAKATTLILVTNTVSARQWRDELLKRTTLTEEEIGEYSGARKEIRPGHHRDLPGADDPPEGRLRPPRAARRPRLGPHRLRRGAPAAGADLPDDRRPPGPAAARPDRDAGPRGRPRGRRLLASSGPSATTPRGRTSRRRATSRRPTASRCG